MNLRQIEVFRAVMRAGSLSGAADVLHVSQPAVSRLIRYLEVKLQIVLFERTGGRLHSTPEARALMREIDAAWRSIDRIQSYAEQLRNGVGDTLRISTNLSTALELVPRAVAALKSSMPQLHISIEIATQGHITDQLLSGECDIGVAAFVESQHPAITHHLIGQGDVLCAMAVTHPLASRKQLTLADIRQYDVISFGNETSHGKVVDDLIGDGEALRNATVEVRYAYTACSIAASGWGIALVDDLTVFNFDPGKLVARPLARPVRYDAYAMASTERPLSASGREMVKLLKQFWNVTTRKA